MSDCASGQGRRRRGFSLIDALVGSFILFVGGLSLTTLMPTMARSQKMSHEMSVATQIASRELEQVKLASYNNCTYSGLRSLNLLDAYPGSGPHTFSNVNLDQASHLSATNCLKNGIAELDISQPTTTVREARATVRWTSASGHAQAVTVSTLLGKDL